MTRVNLDSIDTAETDSVFYTNDDLQFTVSVSASSAFDKRLIELWNKKTEEGIFRYQLNISSERKTDDYGLQLQLNVDRGTNRRTPEDILDLNQPFDHDKFNFNAIRKNEILFKIKKKSASFGGAHYVVINESPLEHGHVLLLPYLYSCLPQIVTLDSLKLAIEFALLHASPNFRVGFNSLRAMASVNHLHYHGYYLKHRMLLESIKVNEVAYPCYKITDFPSKGFAFQIKKLEDIDFIAESIYKLISLFHYRNMPHNIYMTRGISFENVENKEDTDICDRDCLRIYLWSRKATSGVKNMAQLNPATCELFGHLVLKNENDFKSYTERDICTILNDLTCEPFETVLPDVVNLFTDGLVKDVS